jgi:hypothetical protein
LLLLKLRTRIVEGEAVVLLMMHLETNPDEEPGVTGDVVPYPGDRLGVLDTPLLATSAPSTALTRVVIGMLTIMII